MKLRKERNHQYGQSNMDFRSKKDDDKIQLSNPNTFKKNYATGGNAKNSVRPFSKIKNDNEDTLPIFCKTAKTFERRNIKRENITSDNFQITCDSQLKNKTLIKNLKNGLTKQEKKILENYYFEKIEKNKNALVETQLINMKHEETLDNKVDLNKLREVRLMLRRRYASRKDYSKIFKQWNKASTGELTVYEARKMLDNMGIPLNFNETRVLMATSSKRGNDCLNLEEFISFIFPEDLNVNIDLKKMNCKENNN